MTTGVFAIRSLVPSALVLAALLVASSSPAPSALAALGDCGQPVSDGAMPAASDCLFILQASVGSRTCSPACICDVNSAGGISASDGLVCLQKAVGQPIDLNCPCSVTTTSTTLGAASVSVTASVEGDPAPDAALTAEAAIEVTGGCTVESIAWTQTGGAPATINMADMETAMVVLADESAFKDTLITTLGEPPIAADQLPPNVPLPDGEFPGGLPDRFQVVGINPFALEESGLVTVQVTVTASCGTASDTVEIHTALPWKTAHGIRNVPIGRPVLLHGRDHVDEDEDGLDDATGAAVGIYDWTLDSAPEGSTAELVDATSQTPELTPDLVGVYTISVTDTTRLPGDEVVTFEIHAGTFAGVITGEDEDGRPLAANCTGCHDGSPAPDNFTPWKATGHAEIFTDMLNTNPSYNSSCFACHSVGYDPEVDNGGFDDATDFADFLSSGLIGSPSPDNWTNMLANFPASARLANVQCENCHGPQNGGNAHTEGMPRVSLSADVCAVCHGEPARHARFQQWQLSAHANYDLAVEEGDSGNCSRCHTANGFLAWLPTLLDQDQGTDPTANVPVTWTVDEVHPQTCATCHDPHSIGTTSGSTPNATVRISGNTPLLIGGFRALGVGKGAICMTCHNSRRGLRNDGTFAEIAGTSDASSAPHGSVQADLLMGQNAYLVNVGIRGNHSLVRDSCVNCHMEQTPPPDDLSYNQGGTNHTFFASDQICSNCHGAAFDADGVREAFGATIDELELMVQDALIQLMADQIDTGNVIVLGLGGGMERTIADVAEIESLELAETRGRFAATITFTDMSVVGPVALSSFFVRDGLDPATCTMGLMRCELFDFADDRVVKASWNWLLVHNDGSRGVHNPAFTLQVLDASIDALLAVMSGS